MKSAKMMHSSSDSSVNSDATSYNSSTEVSDDGANIDKNVKRQSNTKKSYKKRGVKLSTNKKTKLTPLKHESTITAGATTHSSFRSDMLSMLDENDDQMENESYFTEYIKQVEVKNIDGGTDINDNLDTNSKETFRNEMLNMLGESEEDDAMNDEKLMEEYINNINTKQSPDVTRTSVVGRLSEFDDEVVVDETLKASDEIKASKTNFRNEMLDMLDDGIESGNDEAINDEELMEDYINSIPISKRENIRVSESTHGDHKPYVSANDKISNSEDEASSTDEDAFIVHSTEEALKRIHENGVNKKKQNESEDIFSALFSWCATERDEDM